MRARLAEDGPPPNPEIQGIYPNAAWVSQRQTIINENLGSSLGHAGEVFKFRNIPVLDGERVEVRELSGPRANVEWRVIALEVLGDDYQRIRRLEERLGSESTQEDIVEGDLRLHRDRSKRVSEVWVRWWSRPHLLSSGENDRHFVLERARGRLILGDGEYAAPKQ